MSIILKLEKITKKFGGLKAVSQLNMTVEEGKILGLIGPNGAGKTTIFNLITGVFQPDEGEIIFNNTSVLGLKPYEVCNLGITRTFQLVKPFAGLTVLENVMVGALHLTKNPEHAKKESLEIMDFMHLAHIKDKKAGELTISNRKILEITRALAMKPKLLLLDEPMGGMNPTEIEHMMVQIKKVSENGVNIVIIEHVMKAIMSISNRIVVLHHGEKIAEGTPNEVSKDTNVISAYLGEEYLAT